MNETQKYNLIELLKESSIVKALNNNDFQEIYSRLVKEDKSTGVVEDLYTPAFTELLLKANINPFPYLKEIPNFFISGTDIESIKIPEGIERIGAFAFYKCKKLKNISLPNTLKVIATSAFEKCISLEEITLPESVQILEDDVFFQCTRLTKIYINHPLEPDYVGDDIFYNCPLKDIYYNGDITSWGNLNRSSIHTPPKTIIHCTDGNFKYDAENDSWYEVM